MRIRVSSRFSCRTTSWPAANGIRWVNPSRATLSPSCTRSRTASSSETSSAMVHHSQNVAEVEQVVLHRPLGASGVALLHRGEQCLVLLHHRRLHHGAVKDLHQRGLKHLEHPADQG